MKKFLICLSVFFMFFVTSFNFVHAADIIEFSTWCPKPAESDINGWIALLVSRGDGTHYVHVYTWSNLSSEGNDYEVESSYVDIVLGAHSLSMTAYSSNASSVFTLLQYHDSGINVIKSSTYEGSRGYNYSKTFAAHSVVGYMCGGNVGTVDSVLGSTTPFNLSWGGTVDAKKVSDILKTLTDMGIVLDEISVNFEVALAYFDSILSEHIKSNNWLSKIFSKVTDLYNYFIGNDKSNSSVNQNDSTNTDLNNSINEYDQIESGFTDNLNSSISNLDTTVDLFNVSDFVTTSNFLSTQLTNIFTINQNIQNMIMYSLIMGFAFVLIGIGVKR